MRIWKTKFEMLTMAIIAGVIITLLLFIFRAFSLCLIGAAGTLGILIPLWVPSMSEEWVIFFLKHNGGHSECNNIKVASSKRAILRLKKRGIVQIAEGIVTLVDPDYPCAFDNHNKHSRQ